MAEWKSRPIEELVSQVSSGGTPRAQDPRYYTESGIPFLKIDDITRSRGRFVYKAEQSITRLALEESAAKVFPAGTVLVTMYGTMGVTKTLRSPMATNQAIAALVPPFRCDPDYFALALSFRRAGLERLAAQTTQPNISGTIIRRFQIPIPPLEEQRRIAGILDTIDEPSKPPNASLPSLIRSLGRLARLACRGWARTTLFGWAMSVVCSAVSVCLLDTPTLRRRHITGTSGLSTSTGGTWTTRAWPPSVNRHSGR